MKDGVMVRAPARLHFGVLDLKGDLGRRFGGLGAAVEEPGLEIVLQQSATLEAGGPDGARALGFARAFLAHHGRTAGVRIEVRRALPSHAGLGSGTQLALAVGRGLAALLDIDLTTAEVAAAVGRGARSAIGTFVFDEGGFVLEGGRRDGGGLAPLLLRRPMPASWRCVVVVPVAPAGLSGDAEALAFRTLPTPPATEVERVAHLVLMGMLPALVEERLAEFGAALSEVQHVTGGWFAASQGGAFAPGPTAAVVQVLRDAGAQGVGQSSWGPTVYALAATDAEADRLAGLARGSAGPGAFIWRGPFQNSGAVVQPFVPSVLTD
jgi:beta-ribofuranosylaminobenzene 5'-phosphate synthase